MSSMQHLILQKIEEICTGLKLTIYYQHETSTAGRFYIYNDELDLYLAACYNFQLESVKFNWYDKNVIDMKCGDIPMGRLGLIHNTFLFYHNSVQLKNLFVAIKKWLSPSFQK